MASLFRPGGYERSERQCCFQPGALFILALVSVSMLFAQQACGQATAQTIVAWNPDTAQVAGYDVYYGTSSGNYTSTLNVGNSTSATLQNLSAQTYYIAITAYNSNNVQSGYSPELVIDSLTASAGAGGTISPSGTFFQSQGASQTFTVTPSAGYTIASLKVDGTSVPAAASYTFSNIATNHTIAATFTASVTSYTITASVGANGTISPSGAVKVNSGASQTFTITPSAGYKIASLQVDGTSVPAAANYTFSNIAANHTISATFTASVSSYTITASAGANGTISPSGAVKVNSGASQTLAITPDTGCHVLNVQVDGVSVGTPTSYTFPSVKANHTISATFTAGVTSYTITASAGANGTISPSGAVKVNSGASQTLAITPDTGCHIVNVQVDGVSVGTPNSYTFFSVKANHTIAAIFESHKRYHIRSTARGKGSIRPSGIVSVSAGTTQAFVITPAAYHLLADVLVDGISTGAASSRGSRIASSTYSFAYLSTNHTIEAIFSKIPPPVADAGPDQNVINGSTVTLNGSNSTGSVCGIASYEWTQVAGPKVVLSNPWAAICTFAAPNVTSANVFAFVLKVTNNAGITASNSCLINVAATDIAPSANAGANQVVLPHTIVDLNGSGSFDPDDGIAAYRWVQIQGPRVIVHDAKAADTSFVSSNPRPIGVSLIFQLQVTDQFGLTTRDQCIVNVIRAHLPPFANAGSGQTVAARSSVTLDGSGSFDPDGSHVAYRWKQIRGVPVTLSDPTAQSPFFTTPSISGSQSPDLLFMLTVTGPSGLCASAKCTVTVQ